MFQLLVLLFIIFLSCVVNEMLSGALTPRNLPYSEKLLIAPLNVPTLNQKM